MEVSVLLADDDTVRGLNRNYRGEDSVTNVLAFPGDTEAPAVAGQPRLLGDILLAHGRLRAEAEAQQKSLADHLTHLTVHACLHLLGYDHLNENEAAIMEAEEIAILAAFGIADPYAVGAMDDARALP
jgi:probable rRNA maturation factor